MFVQVRTGALKFKGDKQAKKKKSKKRKAEDEDTEEPLRHGERPVSLLLCGCSNSQSLFFYRLFILFILLFQGNGGR